MPQILSCVSDPAFLSVGCRNHPGSKTEDAGLPWDNCEKNYGVRKPQNMSGVALVKDLGSTSD